MNDFDDFNDFKTILNETKNIWKDKVKNFEIIPKQDIIVDNEVCFRTIVEWKKCMGDLTMAKNDFAPYRYISFVILASDRNNYVPVYCWYDCEQDSLDDIRNAINKGVCVLNEYITAMQ